MNVVFLVFLAGVAVAAESHHATVFLDNQGQFSVQRGIINKVRGVAWGVFDENLNLTGWSSLDIQTNSNYSDDLQAFAAGFVEGFLTAPHIRTTAINIYPTFFGNASTPPRAVSDFLNTQEDWSREMISKNKAVDPFWAQVGFIFQQLDGLVAGYQQSSSPKLDRFQFQMLNAVGDLFDIIPAVQPHKQVNYMNMTTSEAIRKHSQSGHCSAIIKLPGNYGDLFYGHSSWYTFVNTNRIFKHYNFAYSAASQTRAHGVSFSSYPGFLESLDDFYMLSSGIGWTQTTNSVIDQTVYTSVKPQSLLAWQRVRVASSMASSGSDWFSHFQRYYSGTYANQYMIVDFNKFSPSTPLQADTLWVVEEMPGLIVGGDLTDTLSRGYFSSYNVPYWPAVFNKSGYPPMVEKHGNYFSYELAPRAQIFRRDQGNVEDMTSLKTLLRYNNFKNDPYSFDGKSQNPSYAICARDDLAAQNPRAGGCYDTKVSSYLYGAKDRKCEAINGPTRSPGHGDLPAFSWDNPDFAMVSHLGLPTTYNFDFIPVAPSNF